LQRCFELASVEDDVAFAVTVDEISGAQNVENARPAMRMNGLSFSWRNGDIENSGKGTTSVVP